LIDLRDLLTPRRLLALVLLCIAVAGPVACARYTGEPSARPECHKHRGQPEC